MLALRTKCLSLALLESGTAPPATGITWEDAGLGQVCAWKGKSPGGKGTPDKLPGGPGRCDCPGMSGLGPKAPLVQDSPEASQAVWVPQSKDEG